MKYWQVVTSTWDEMMTYRFNFAMWRFRNVLQLLSIYFLWLAVTPANGQLFGYSQSIILTYIIGAAFLSSIVLATRTHEVGDQINNGDLSLFLVRPLNYFGYWFARDLGDKAVNVGFAIVELILVYSILHPALFLQTNMVLLFFVVLAVLLALVLYFFIGMLLGFIGFWSPEVWAPRFILFIIINFFAGGIFPLDILPKSVFAIFQLMPFTYLLYFPLKIYLGQLTFVQIASGFTVLSIWIVVLFFLVQFVWRKGLRTYSAQGH